MLVGDCDRGLHGLASRSIGVHRHLGPGLLESAYEQCLCHELSVASIPYEPQKVLPSATRAASCSRDIGSTWSWAISSWWS
jgi:GxxExxY protein